MNRTIKFRAWSIENKKMYPVDGFTCNWNRSFVTKTSELVIKKDNILMQFTGLLDCEGKEIYESDIVKGSWGYSGVVTLSDILYAERECTIPDDLKVLGNVYEHSNLLNNKD